MKGKSKIEVSFEVRNGRTLSHRKEYYDNGVMALDGLFSNGGHWGWDIPNGTIRTYFKNGVLRSEELCDENGSRDGESRFYNDQGTMIRRASYVKDRKTHEEFYDKSGKPIPSNKVKEEAHPRAG